ncbi:hypothetical protein LIER_35224 [Lithospermum erythrorhizon]|uniref:Uncharacterized protein n=1 Tax=Lithospermum erythrorhizon TaxID=34254 RepID=A0AAV3NM22_LITER
MTGPSDWPKTSNITLLAPKCVSQTCKYCGIIGHNIRTCVKKKKADIEGRGVHPKKCTRASKRKAAEQSGYANFVTEEEIAAHEAYFLNLQAWLNDINNIVPNIPAQVPQEATKQE